MRISFIGSVGVPNCYGGFESFLEACTPEIASQGHTVHVTCDAQRYASKEIFWHGVQRHFISIPANNLWSIPHDLAAFFAVVWRTDTVVVLGVSGGIWFPLMRLVCSLLRVRLVVNIDGVEWRRGGSLIRRCFLYFSDRLAQFFSHAVVFDNSALFPYVIGTKRGKSRMIPYPGDNSLPIGDTHISEGSEASYALTICRIEPENNCDLLLEAVSNSNISSYVFIGNWQSSAYGRRLLDHFANRPGFQLLDPIYDPKRIARFRNSCAVYLHGHSVGGTNPSLVEMLFYNCPIIAYDCSFNRATAAGGALYFKTQDELVSTLNQLTALPSCDRAQIRTIYTRHKICDDYLLFSR
jgi:glycosyltransferase involved in cell wall biosynthesis